MSQVLITLNFSEQQWLEQWLNENKPDCSLRALYDHFIAADQRELCAIEGTITKDLIDFLRYRYGSLLKSNLRFSDSVLI